MFIQWIWICSILLLYRLLYLLLWLWLLWLCLLCWEHCIRFLCLWCWLLYFRWFLIFRWFWLINFRLFSWRSIHNRIIWFLRRFILNNNYISFGLIILSLSRKHISFLWLSSLLLRLWFLLSLNLSLILFLYIIIMYTYLSFYSSSYFLYY